MPDTFTALTTTTTRVFGPGVFTVLFLLFFYMKCSGSETLFVKLLGATPVYNLIWEGIETETQHSVRVHFY